MANHLQASSAAAVWWIYLAVDFCMKWPMLAGESIYNLLLGFGCLCLVPSDSVVTWSWLLCSRACPGIGATEVCSFYSCELCMLPVAGGRKIRIISLMDRGMKKEKVAVPSKRPTRYKLLLLQMFGVHKFVYNTPSTVTLMAFSVTAML